VLVGGMSAFFVERFPTAARYTGFSLGYQLASVLGGAVAPVIGVALLDRYGSTVPVSLYAAAMAVPRCSWCARRRGDARRGPRESRVSGPARAARGPLPPRP
jgi:hypothetical protein